LAGVTVTAVAGDVKASAITASTPAADVGRYTVADLPTGDYTVSFAKEGFVTQTLHVTLGVGQPVTVNVPMQGEPGTVSGTASSCTVAEARRRDLSDLDPRRQAVPAEDGTYALSDLPTPGEYRLVFRGPLLRTVDVTLGPGEKRAVNGSCAAATTTTTVPPSTTSSSTTSSSTTSSSTSSTSSSTTSSTTATTGPAVLPP
jgi:hypothetical protein